jgi:hypothetical protein
VLRTKQRTTVDGATVGDDERAHSYRWVGCICWQSHVALTVVHAGGASDCCRVEMHHRTVTSCLCNQLHLLPAIMWL